MKPTRLMVILGLATVLLTSQQLIAQTPVAFEASYQATSRGLSATAQRYLRQTAEQQFELGNILELRVLGTRLGRAEERSSFRWHGDTLIPLSYVYEQTGLGGRLETVDFNWIDGLAQSREDESRWEIPLHEGVQDKLSFQALLAQQLRQGNITEVTLNVVDNERIEPQLYRVIGEEVIDTPLGQLNTLRVDRIREPGSSRQTSFWLATDWSMLLARLVQVSGNGAETELLLETANVAGQAVTALP